MAIVLPSTRTEPVPGRIVKFTVNSTEGNGDYELLPIPARAKGISVKLSGTDGTAVCTLSYKNQTDGTIEAFTSGTIAATEELNVNCGAFTETYLNVASTDGATDLDVEGSIYD